MLLHNKILTGTWLYAILCILLACQCVHKVFVFQEHIVFSKTSCVCKVFSKGTIMQWCEACLEILIKIFLTNELIPMLNVKLLT